jgi:hypothetical protein
VRGPYRDRFVNGQVAGVIRVSVPFRSPSGWGFGPLQAQTSTTDTNKTGSVAA